MSDAALSRTEISTVRLVLLALLSLVVCLPACTFLKNAAIQSDYERIQATDPSMLNLKHMVSRQTYFVYGKIGEPPADGRPLPMLSIAAYSDQFQKHELVDVMHQLTPGAHYGLNLPPGAYQLVVFADANGNGVYEAHEAIAVRSLQLADDGDASMIKGNVDMVLGAPAPLAWPVALKVQTSDLREQSLFFPPNTIRSLDDPLFDPAMATLGMYQPAAFLEKAGTMFYALEEDIGYKIPVIFVHGIDGSARDLEPLVSRLDRKRFKPWFFHYPSGGDLDQMADFFYSIFLSGKVIPYDDKMPMVIVAHSMGGLVVRQALNKVEPDAKRDLTFISLASPFGGMPSAESGKNNGLLVLPSWRNLSPSSPFIQDLFTKPLAPSITHRLIYAYGDPRVIKTGEKSDGTVPLSSQLVAAATRQAKEQVGIEASHVGVLRDARALDYVLAQIDRVTTGYPENHMAYFLQGGFDQPLNPSYSKRDAYVIRHYGKYIRALALAKIEPQNAFQHGLIDVTLKKKAASSDEEKAWLKFITDYPEVMQGGT